MRVTPQCDPIDFFVICQEDSVQNYPTVAFDGSNYIVAWADARFGEYRIVSARVTPQGAVLDTGYCIGQTGVCEQSPRIAFDGSRCLVVWKHELSPPYGIYGRFVNSSAMPEDTVIVVDTCRSFKSKGPKITWDNNNYFVVWADMAADTTYDIYGRLVSAQGGLVGNRITISNALGSQKMPDVVFDGTKYLVVWSDNDTVVVGQYVNTAGQLVGSSFIISNSTSNKRRDPCIAVSDTNFLVAWAEEDTFFDIYGNSDLALEVKEGKKSILKREKSFSTVFTGNLELPKNRKYRLYDISGRVVDNQAMQSGIYFIEIDGKITQKIIKIR